MNFRYRCVAGGMGLVLGGWLPGCGSSGSPGTGPAPVPISVELAVSPIVVPQDGSTVFVAIKINSTSETAAVTVESLPAGLKESYAASDTNPSGSLAFTATATTAAGTYAPTVLVNSAGQTTSLSFQLIVAAVVTVRAEVDTASGVNGALAQFMSTSIPVDGSGGGVFGTGAPVAEEEAQLTMLGPRHLRLQVEGAAIPMKSAADWNFELLDATVQPALNSADRSPVFQIAAAPGWMCDSSGHFEIDAHLADLAAYAANLVRYYNRGGFDSGGVHYQSPASSPIAWWGIFNEPERSGLSPADYVALYNGVVPAMLAVDPSIHFSALEIDGSQLGSGLPEDATPYLTAFLAPAGAGGVQAQVDVIADHLYSVCDSTATDTAVFQSVDELATATGLMREKIGSRSDLTEALVWTTANNVNSDYALEDGTSACNPGRPFVLDPRGTSAFFAAWRSYVFSRLGKAGDGAVFHSRYAGDGQSGEVDAEGHPYLSYWVDKALAAMYSPPGGTDAPQILALSATDTSTIETLATQNGDGSVVVMIVDRAVSSGTDNNGSGAARTVMIDLSKLPRFSSGQLSILDSTTNLGTGPSVLNVAPASKMTISLGGYGVAFLRLIP